MRHAMTLFVAKKEINQFMRMVDLKPDCKWYVDVVETSFTTKTNVDDDYFMSIIEKSKDGGDFWIPAIKYMDNLFFDPGVKILSDGNKEMFIQQLSHD